MSESEKLDLRRYYVIPHAVQKRMGQHPLCKMLFLTEIGYEGESTFRPFKKHSAANHYLLVLSHILNALDDAILFRMPSGRKYRQTE